MPEVAVKPLQVNEEKRNYPTLIIGWNTIARSSFDKISSQTHNRIVGVIDVEPEEKTVKHHKGVPVYPGLRDFRAIVEKHGVKYAFIALDPQDYPSLHKITLLCQKHGLEYDIASDFYDVVYGHSIQNVFKEVFTPGPFNLRRFFDLTFALVTFILFLPLWILVAIAIKLDSRGTVLYSQERVGYGGKTFRIYKFRTMVQDAEKQTGPTWASKSDPRITRVGQFLRKTRIDEIPQLLNVLAGNMSVIGPRPERPYFVEKFKENIPMYGNRLKVKPGLTGLAQVESGYDESEEDVKRKLSYDITYIQKQNILLDLKIMFKTIWVVLTGKGQ